MDHSSGGFFVYLSITLQAVLRPLLNLCISAAVVMPLVGEEPAPVRFSDAPHDYWTRPTTDAVSAFIKRLQAGELTVEGNTEKDHLVSVLKALDIPASSQLLVYSATSLQSGLITPRNPRALYFNEEVYVGYVPGGKLEMAAIDPEAGAVFHILSRTQGGGPPRIERTERCMNCHGGNAMRRLPGFFTESVIPSQSGGSLDGFRRDKVGHAVPLEDRFGGWHLTGAHEREFPLANITGRSDGNRITRIKNPPGGQYDWEPYLTQTSDLLTHLIHEHQLEFHNLVTLAVYRTREALQRGDGSLSSADVPGINAIARDLVRYILFANEAKLPRNGVKPDEAFMKDFLARKKASSSGLSLRDLDLKTRLFRHRCSYMIYTPGFQALPPVVKDRVMAGLRTALSDTSLPEFAYLPQLERRQIRGILAETLPDF
jgi:hypothetical protein